MFPSSSRSSTAPDAKARTTALAVQLAEAPHILVGARFEVRRFETDAGVTRWTLMGGAEGRQPSAVSRQTSEVRSLRSEA